MSGLEPWDAAPTNTGKKGGDLDGIVEHLDWLVDLGVTALYLNPVFVSPANHRYHVSDYFHVDPLLGGDAAFDRLLAACHERDLRVVLDGVFNHSGRGFFAFVDVAENGEASRYRDWFSVSRFPIRPYGPGPHGYAAWCDNPALPKLDTENPEVREYLMSVAEHWVERGIDGWRLDTPEQIETRGFWQEFRERTKAKNPDLYLVGEIWTDARAWIGDAGRFDGVLNYYFGGRTLAFVGGESLDLSLCENIDYPLKRTIDAREMARFTADLSAGLPLPALSSCLNLDSSHDTPRLASMLSGDRDRVRLAKLLQFAFVGAPCILYGDEIGLAGAGDPACRAGFPWSAPEQRDTELLEWVRSLARLRREQPALRQGSIAVLDSGPRDLFVSARARRTAAGGCGQPGQLRRAGPAPTEDFRSLARDRSGRASPGRRRARARAAGQERRHLVAHARVAAGPRHPGAPAPMLRR